ncbi:MAG TPA: response regulator [Candidatus Dormibacteraeota bacterium]|jgi:CheY-like chemotaxis protein|nr:response regulator [Candidatus Dormibacteraeota bacterium]
MADILVAEDNPLNFELIRDILESDGHSVRWAKDGVDAVSQAHGQPCDLMLLDLHMPKLDGLQVLRQLRVDEPLRSLKVVVVSADAMGDVRETVIDAGADGYLTKPLEIRTLLAEVDRQLA